MRSEEKIPLAEYPRPQMQRQSYVNLNGRWEYAITKDSAEPAAYDGFITVPFSPECELSGVMRQVMPEDTLWYRRELPDIDPAGGRVLLHFGAVDQMATVYVNNKEVCTHVGGFTPFTADITEYLDNINDIRVKVKDLSDTSYHSRGKQRLERGGIWYTAQSGIWQTVWMERVSADYISSLRIKPMFDEAAVEVTVISAKDLPVSVDIEGQRAAFLSNTPAVIPMPGFIPWSPENPQLYRMAVTLGEDTVNSYFAMRKFSVGRDEKKVWRLMLNNKPYFHNGVLDQGYWAGGMLTAPTDEALINDIQLMKDMGFNMLRKHIKLEPLRYYYHCDRLGMLVWQDMINGGGQYDRLLISAPLITHIHKKDSDYARFARADEEGRRQYYSELSELIDTLYNSPCVAMWVPFNEGWGQFDANKAVEFIRERDDTRTIDHASGWHDQRGGDVKSLHVYFVPYRFRKDKHRPVVLSEFGGYNLRVEGHAFNKEDYGYRRYTDPKDLFAALALLYREQIKPAKKKGLCAAVYTQLSDVEDELNGFVTYDREEIKLPVEAVREIVGELTDKS